MDMALEKDEAEEEQRKQDALIRYMSMQFSQQDPMGGKEDPKRKKAREEFEKALRPKEEPKKIGPAKVYAWDFEKMEKLKAKQK